MTAVYTNLFGLGTFYDYVDRILLFFDNLPNIYVEMF